MADDKKAGLAALAAVKALRFALADLYDILHDDKMRGLEDGERSHTLESVGRSIKAAGRIIDKYEGEAE